MLYTVEKKVVDENEFVSHLLEHCIDNKKHFNVYLEFLKKSEFPR